MAKQKKTPEQLKQIRHEAAIKAAATRKAREAQLTPEAREALRIKRAVILSQNRKTRTTKPPKQKKTPEQLKQIRHEAAIKAAATRKAREAQLTPEAREALKAERAQRAKEARKKDNQAKKFFERLKSDLQKRLKQGGLSSPFYRAVAQIISKASNTTATQQRVYQMRERIDYALKRGQYPTSSEDIKEALRDLEAIFSDRTQDFKFERGFKTYTRILEMYSALPAEYTWKGEILKAQYEWHIQYANALMRALEDVIERDGFIGVMRRIDEQSENIDILAQTIMYDSNESNVRSALTQFVTLINGKTTLTPEEAQTLNDIIETEFEDWEDEE
nr:MAG TPA: hypothetical protein [Caudoviricetes sp.]